MKNLAFAFSPLGPLVLIGLFPNRQTNSPASTSFASPAKNTSPRPAEVLSIDTAPSSLPAPVKEEPSSSEVVSRQGERNAEGEPSSTQAASASSSTPSQRVAPSSQSKLNVPHCGSHYSHTTDADLPSSSSVVVRPPRSELENLQVHVHGIAFAGAKSRVETQIRTRIELVRPVGNSSTTPPSQEGGGAWERIGSFDHVKLPPMTGTKRKSKKHKPADIAAEKTLFMDATVVRATPPHNRIYVCRSCQQRERKRAQRKRVNHNKDPSDGDAEKYSTDDMKDLGVDPSAPNAQLQAAARAKEEDEKRVVVFNCGDFVNFEDGACVLPTRITCYCRHHAEKTGFCLIFTMRDYRGNLIATGSTPPIMITDDHKSVAAAQLVGVTTNIAGGSVNGNPKNANGSSSSSSINSSSGPPLKRVEGTNSRSRAASAEDEGDLRSKSTQVRKKNRTKPYGDAESRAQRRSASSSSHANTLSMTPFSGSTTPAVGQSPGSASADINHPDFWAAFASMSVPGSSSPQAQAPPSSSNVPQEWVQQAANDASLSSHTLNYNPQSIPDFDVASFARSLQSQPPTADSSAANDEATMQQLMALARSLPGMQLMPGTAGFANSMMQREDSRLPPPAISKLIPGEGPISGGIEVTVLGENFVDGLTCLFGDQPATSTKVWGANTLLCILPPSASPGPVAVTIKGEREASNTGRNHPLQLFTYTDTNDRALMELALQVVGMQMTGTMQTARDVAMRVVGSGGGVSMGSSGQQHSSSGSHGGGNGHNLARDAVAGLFGGAGSSSASFQTSVIHFLSLLDVQEHCQRKDAIRLANRQGHTLLHLAVMLGHHRLVQLLLARGCPANARDHSGYTALHFAALHGRMTIARLLLAHGARDNVMCEVGKLAIEVAREREQVDVEFLLRDNLSVSAAAVLDDVSYSSLKDSGVSMGGDWTDDESVEIDDGNISSSLEDDDEEEDDDDDNDEGHDSDEVSEEHSVSTPRAFGSVTPEAASDEKKLVSPSSSPTTEKRKLLETTLGLRGLVTGGLDLANKLQQLPELMPALHDRFHHMHMQLPAVPVFHLAMPTTPSFMMARQADSGSAKGKTREGTDTEDRINPEQDEGSGRVLLSAWRSIVEESASWINPLYSPPPPTYESTLASHPLPVLSTSEKGFGSTSQDSRSISHSRFPAIAQPSPDSPHKRLSPPPSGRSSSWHGSLDRSSSSLAPVSSSRASTSSSNLVASSSSSLLGATATTVAASATRKKGASLKEDRMLVYFWIPTLVFVAFVLIFASPSSVLSYKDLTSYIPSTQPR